MLRKSGFPLEPFHENHIALEHCSDCWGVLRVPGDVQRLTHLRCTRLRRKSFFAVRLRIGLAFDWPRSGVHSASRELSPKQVTVVAAVGVYDALRPFGRSRKYEPARLECSSRKRVEESIIKYILLKILRCTPQACMTLCVRLITKG